MKVKQNLTNKCPVCESKKINFHSDYRNLSSCFNNLKKFYCNDCDLIFSNPMPGNLELDEYNSNYHNNAHGGYNRDKKLKAFFNGIAKTRLHTISKYTSLNPDEEIKILEIGPGPGVFAKQWINKYSKSEYYAIETDTNLHNELIKIGIKIIKEENLKSYKSYFDFIIISHVLEHVTNPVSFLKPMIESLKKNSHLFIEVPCKDWDHKELDEPHLLFFDKKSFYQLFKKLNMEKVFIGYFGTKIKHLKSPIFKTINGFKQKLFYRDINIHNPERKKLNKILNSRIETNAVINFSPHIEQNEPSWWIRTIVKK
tara:strand:+ start:3441 stop:4376 length:936 start_codon:yes stop_codon:yes gene_type:complete